MTTEDLFFAEYRGQLNRDDFELMTDAMVTELEDAFIGGMEDPDKAWRRWVRWIRKQDFMEGRPKFKSDQEAHFVFNAVDSVHPFS